METLVKNASPGHATVEIDLGSDSHTSNRHVLEIYVSSDTDRYQRVTVDWIAPAKVTGKPSETRDRRRVRLVRALLDKDNAQVDDWARRPRGRVVSGGAL